jgi:16S rRNA C967 or C1407 C5-methylase (RsmB/RsmF family)
MVKGDVMPTLDVEQLGDGLATMTTKDHRKDMDKKHSKLDVRKDAVSKLFHDFYKAQYGAQRWLEELLPALREPTRYCCLVNQFAAPDIVAERLQSRGSNKEEATTKTVDPFLLEQLPFISIPCLYLKNDHLINNKLPFPSPVKDFSNITVYYLLDAASVMATEALSIKPDHTVLDLCAAPGGKSLALVQRLMRRSKSSQGMKMTGSITCNESSPERRRRLRTVLNDYIPALAFDEGRVTVTGHDGTKWGQLEADGQFDRVLVDAPCSSERHLLHDDDELVQWTQGRSKTLAQKQLQLLLSALGAVRPGGLVLYATCSISDTENDLVLEKAKKKSPIKFKIVSAQWGKGDDSALKQRKWPIGSPTKYGWIVLPDSGGRWGPLFFALCKRSKDNVEDI